MKRRVLASALLSASAVLVALSCRQATQVTLEITYGDPCARLRSVGIIASSDARAAEQRASRAEFTTVTASCTATSALTSRVGSLSVSPGDGKTRAAVTIIAGVDTPADQCRPENGFKGCIVARRSFAFLAHSAPTFPIRLEPACKDVPCDATTTCKKGQCVDASAECNDAECVDKVPDEPAADGGGPDAQVDGGVDGEAVDAPADTGVDASLDAGPRDPSCDMPTTPKFCPPYVDPVVCTMANCGIGSVDGGTCTNVNFGPFNATCTATRQCPASQFCCWNGMSNTSFCAPAPCGSPPARMLCRFDCDCPGGQSCQLGTPGPEPPFIKFCKP